MKWFKTDWAGPEPETHEKKERQWVLDNIPSGGVFVDVGADVGSWAVNLAHHFDKVYAIEPSKEDWWALHHNVDLNGLNEKVLLENWAADAMNGKLVLSSRTIDHVPNWFVSYLVDSAFDKWDLVEARTLDSLKVSPKLIKIDVEGWGAQVLRGATETLTKTEYVIVEIHNDEEKMACINILQSASFSACHKSDSGSIWYFRKVFTGNA